MTAAAADLLAIGVAACSTNTLTNMQQLVISPVLANHEITVRVVAPIAVEVVDFCALW